MGKAESLLHKKIINKAREVFPHISDVKKKDVDVSLLDQNNSLQEKFLIIIKNTLVAYILYRLFKKQVRSKNLSLDR